MAALGGVRHLLALFPALACSTWVAAAEPSSSPDLDQIVITGNHLVESDIHSISPVTIIDNAAIAASSATSVEQLLARQPIFGTQGVNGNQDDGGYGAAFVDLRGLNFDRTLVLVNGRHFVKSGIQTDEAAGRSQSIMARPINAISPGTK